jgi:hypothetical protein
VLEADRATRIFRRLASERLFRVILSVALLLPLIFSRGDGARPMVGLPLITSGDEPHYLVMIHSLLSDHDFDLSNNYANARRGSIDIGAGRAFAPLDHQVSWYAADGSWHEWDKTYEYLKDPGQPDGLAPMPSLRPGASAEFATRPQYSQHPVGLPVLLAPFLYPFRGTVWVEHLAITLTVVGTFLMALFLRQLFRALSDDMGMVNAAVVLAVLTSPTWHYSRSLFSEPWLTLFVVGALALAVQRRGFFLAGCLIALGIQMKPPFALFALPLVVDRLLERDLKRAIAFAVPVSVSVALVLFENQVFFGAPTRSAQPWSTGNPLVGITGLLFSWNHGLLLFAPAVLVASLGWPSLFRAQRRIAWLAIAMAGSYFLLMATWSVWAGGHCYGPRLIAPVVPLLYLGIVQVLARFPQLTPRFQRAVVAVCALSFVTSAIGALAHMGLWSKHPLITPVMMLKARADIARH